MKVDKTFLKALSGFTYYPREILILQHAGSNVIYASYPCRVAWISWPSEHSDVKLKVTKYLPTNYGTFVELSPAMSWNEFVFSSYPRVKASPTVEMDRYSHLPEAKCDWDVLDGLIFSSREDYVSLSGLGIYSPFSSVFAPPFRKLAPLSAFGVDSIRYAFGKPTNNDEGDVFGLILTCSNGVTMHAYSLCVGCFTGNLAVKGG